MKCPNCVDGMLFPAFPHKYPPEGIPCDICKGSGILPDDVYYDPERGKSWKDERIGRGVKLRDEAKRLNMDVCELSRRERGYFPK